MLLGGTVIETEDQARAYTKAIRADSAVWGDRGMDFAPVRVGEEFGLEMCVPPHWPLRTEERPCPRVELWPENDLAARIVFAALPEHTRPLLPEYVEALVADLTPEDARRTVARAFRTLQSSAVTDWMRSQYEKAAEGCS